MAKKADEYGVRRIRVATTPHDSDEDSNNSTDKAAKPRATNKANKAMQDCARRVRVAIAHENAMAT